MRHARRFAARVSAALTAGLMAALTAPMLALAAPAAAQPSLWADKPELGDDAFLYFEDASYDASVPTPAEHIGHQIGEHFTRHSQQLDYLRALAEASDRVRIRQYGLSTQRRPLALLAISSPDNIDRLPKILAMNRELANPAELTPGRLDEIAESMPTIAWLSFNVHGNEAACAEAAIAFAYELAAAEHEKIDHILDNVVVMIDPMLNPDGHERYVAFYENATGRVANPSHDAAERREPWPGGRSNHYLFDLNRDWVWMTQLESQARIPAYREALPHLHIDVHEQGFRSPYFFGPGDTPYHEHIPASTKEWLEIYGKANERTFDERGLEFATKERFDYLYPGYGKVLPCYHGAVGLLTEKGGHSFAGRSVDFNDRETVTLRERAQHHFLTSMDYVLTSADFREGQIRRFASFFEGAVRLGRDEPLTIIIDPANDPALLQKLWNLCTGHGIRIEQLDEHNPAAITRRFRDGKTESAPTGDRPWVIRADQPMGYLVRALFEPATFVEDRDTYDITSWNVPTFFGLNSWYTTDRLIIESSEASPPDLGGGDWTEEGVALLINGDQWLIPTAMGIAQRHEIVLRHAAEPFTLEGTSFGVGTLIARDIRNRHTDLKAFAEELIAAGVDIHRATTSVPDDGMVLSVNANGNLPLTHAAIVSGSGISSLSFGHLWHLVDVVQPISYTNIRNNRLSSVDLDKYSVLVLPSGASFGESTTDMLQDYVRGGGTIVAMGSAASYAERSILGMDRAEDPGDLPDREPASELTYAERGERGVDDRIPGATMRVLIDQSHPLAVGLSDWAGVLVRSSRVLATGSSTYVVARYDDMGRMNGSISERNQQRLAGTPFMAHDRFGSGQVIRIAHDVTDRGFMFGNTRLLMNAIVYGPGL